MKKPMPTPETYNQENKYMPWGQLIEELVALITSQTPKNSQLLDLMCGTGFLVKKILSRRPDLKITGVDFDSRYIDFARENIKQGKFICADVLTWEAKDGYDLVLCTGGIHHIKFENQIKIVQKIKSLLAEGGIAITADPFIGNYSNEVERKFRAEELGDEYIKAVLARSAPKDIIQATIDIKNRDIVLDGEYKTSTERFEAIAKKIFGRIKKQKVWPKTNSDYGDYYYILRK